VEQLGGEGLMLREPGSNYQSGRSTSLLKVKTFHDAEAVVIGHEAGKGKHTGRLGALVVRLPSGITFSVGTGFTDAARSTPPPVGATITFRYQELTEAGVPRFPSYVGVRVVDVPVLAGPLTPAEPTAPPTTTVVSLPTASTSTAGKPRYFEYTDAKSSKFWEVVQNGCDMTTRWGKIGATGQSKTKTFASEEAAAKQVAKLIEEKTSEGYVERGASAP
jgi:DNA ligase-1